MVGELMKTKKGKLGRTGILVVMGSLAAIFLISFLLIKIKGITGAAVLETEQIERDRLQIAAGDLEEAAYRYYDLNSDDWVNRSYYRIWVDVYNPGQEVQTLSSIRLVDGSGNQYDPYASIAYQISQDEKVFGSSLKISPHERRGGYVTFPVLETKDVKLVFAMGGNVNIFNLG